jgi:hypothetical protein
MPSSPLLAEWMAFRCRTITKIVVEASAIAKQHGMRVGLDCFAPSLARMVGQDLARLSASCDWIKSMVYLRAFGPASIPFEMLGLAAWLTDSGEQPDTRPAAAISDLLGWPAPPELERIRHNGLATEILTGEIRRGRVQCGCEFLAGIELVEMTGVCELADAQFREDARAVLAAKPDGVVFSWDLWRMPEERLMLAGELFGAPGPRGSP